MGSGKWYDIRCGISLSEASIWLLRTVSSIAGNQSPTCSNAFEASDMDYEANVSASNDSARVRQSSGPISVMPCGGDNVLRVPGDYRGVDGIDPSPRKSWGHTGPSNLGRCGPKNSGPEAVRGFWASGL